MDTQKKKCIFEIAGDCVYEQNPPFNFAALHPDYSRFDNSWAVIIQAPYDATTTYQPGTRNAPASIIQASQQLELFDEEIRTEVFEKGICTLSPLEVDVSSPFNMVKRVEAVVGLVRDAGKFPVLIGGEHLVSVGAIRAMAGNQDFKVVHFDAHADLRKTYQSSEYSNACVMRLVSETCDFISVGVRSLSREEHEFIEKNGITCIYAKEVMENLDLVSEKLIEFANDSVYVTIDLDVFDPSVMPAVGTPEPGGLLWYDVLCLLRRLFKHSKVVGFDVVELLPQPGNIAPDFTAARLIYKILSYAGYYLDKNFNL